MNKETILVINNYDMESALELAKQSKYPYHHCWGIDEIVKSYNVKFVDISKAKNNFVKILYQIKICVLSIGCSKVYSACFPGAPLLAFLKKIGVHNKRMIEIVHHVWYPNLFVNLTKYDKLLLISKWAFDIMQEKYKKKENLMELIEWAPDIAFYDNVNVNYKIPKSFISNGKTKRDNETLRMAGKYLSENAEIKILDSENKISYLEMVRFCKNYQVMVIPCFKNNTHINGLTSLMDALALGMPVVVSRSANWGINVEKEGFGFVYEDENAKDLADKMSRFINDPNLIESMGRKGLQYAQNYSYKKFCEKILSSLE